MKIDVLTLFPEMFHALETVTARMFGDAVTLPWIIRRKQSMNPFAVHVRVVSVVVLAGALVLTRAATGVDLDHILFQTIRRGEKNLRELIAELLAGDLSEVARESRAGNRPA